MTIRWTAALLSTNAPWYARDAEWCAYQVPGVCRGRATSTDHRVKRSRGGDRSPANLISACGDGTVGCHGWAEAHPAEAHDLGWSLPVGTDPTAAPVFLRHRVWGEGWFLLGDDFTITPCGPPAAA